MARGFFLFGERLHLDWLENQLEAAPAATRWQRWARQSMEDDLFSLRRSLCERALELAGGAPIDEAIERYFSDGRRSRASNGSWGLGIEGVTDLSQLTVALRQIRALAA